MGSFQRIIFHTQIIKSCERSFIEGFDFAFLTLFRLGIFGRPWTGGGVKRPPPPYLRFFKTIKDIDMKPIPLIKRREINLLLLSFLSCDVI